MIDQMPSIHIQLKLFMNIRIYPPSPSWSSSFAFVVSALAHPCSPFGPDSSSGLSERAFHTAHTLPFPPASHTQLRALWVKHGCLSSRRQATGRWPTLDEDVEVHLGVVHVDDALQGIRLFHLLDLGDHLLE